jgi:hypothetical protein
MTNPSQITYAPIDENYPVAGQDNNSQGFRDNFSYIKTGLSTAKSEITDLRNNAARTDADNNFNANEISNAVTKMIYGVVDSSTLTTDTTIDIRDAEYFKCAIGANMTITFSQWPSGSPAPFAKVRLELISDGTPRLVSFATTGGGVVRYSDDWPAASPPSKAIALSANTSYSRFIEVWTTNAGSTVFVKNLGQFQ